ncbi:phosphate/phosphite/phosphonate ABC transporter substrate-binding protein [Photobacterium galatheae]|uniref:Phosphate ABC transporter substrate-binding protein n=1 Tax=Photobacterium galatheae TaxID=1654360 RepID=A0A066RW94_9GAMM|nr:phosphate/phosphite/phosphonate ABC transporter substrate-binding protein [Photobacterium galatheae]KDM93386.1 phosphate ABC transporter substrate-binding protein [Photobacterium galatheae]MCM0146965.1 phosphate/phosphite/phosphonate ABC transporter substrate-binding protein [Photobacterium galatheae]
MRILIALFLALLVTQPAHTREIIFGIVPQQAASKLARVWTPILTQVSALSGHTIHFATAPDIPTFEKRLKNGEYDLAYMNPYHYVVFHQEPGYKAIAKAANKQIKGIIVVRKDSGIATLPQLDQQTLAFPSPAAFAASILTRTDLSAAHVRFTPKYVSSHDSVYLAVAQGIFPAGGGVMRTFNSIDPAVRNQLTPIWTTKGYTSHAIAVHPRIDHQTATSIQQALIALSDNQNGQTALTELAISGFEAAQDGNWDDIRALQIDLLHDLLH